MKSGILFLLVLISAQAIAQQIKGSPSASKKESGKAEIYIIEYCTGLYPINNLKKYTPRFRDPFDYTFTRQELSVLPINDLQDVVSLLPGIYQSRRGDDLNIFGARTVGTHYIVDGMQLSYR